MQTTDRSLAALKAAQKGMFRALGVMEAIHHLNEEAGLRALIEAGKQVLGTTFEDVENAIDAIGGGAGK